MKSLVLAMVLTVMQTAPPVPRKAADTQTHASSHVKNESNTDHRPSDQSPSTVESKEKSDAATGNSSQHRQDDANNTVVIREFPTVSIKIGWGDIIYLIFSGLLVAVGAFQVQLLCMTFRAVRHQASEMTRQRLLMREQLNEIRAAGEQTDKLIGQATKQAEQLTKSADAAKTTAESLRAMLDAMVSKEEARIKVGVDNINLTWKPTNGNAATFWIENYGLSTAFVDDFKARFIIVEGKDIIPDYEMCKGVMYVESIQANTRFGKSPYLWLEPNAILTEEQVMSIRNGKSSVHFYGFVKYRTIFKRNKRMNLHLRWEMRWGGMVQDQIMQWWEPVGPPEENSDIEDKNPN